MSLKQQIDGDIKQAMLQKKKEELTALRAIKSAILLAETEKGAGEGLESEAEMKLLAKQAKQRKDSADIYAKEGRDDLASKELFELEIINRYLPKQLSETEIEEIVKGIISKVGASGRQDMGKVMGSASKEMSGKADGKKISEIVKKLLSN
ncbi:GatB/YqeY domain-containing protein [Fulvivirga sp.]|uniref:GatB/YqeY domain-containing protein n=1 Tax=Fulvivirga sp. TaxID=1931237 RepID=UPI0032F04925